MAMPNEAQLANAVALLSLAEKELQLALEQLQTVDRADKQMVSFVVQAALEKLAVSKRTLDDLSPRPG